MKWQWSFISLLVICVHLSHQRSTPDSMSYKAAVVEYEPKYYNDAAATFRANTDAYERFIKDAAAQDVDIIVFPEYGLSAFAMIGRDQLKPWTTLIPPASAKYTPCIDHSIHVSESLKRLSCAARNNQIYVVVNLMERKPCRGKKNCPKDGVFYYNSNVVFDRNGTIIARYRKTNLIGEFIYDLTKKPEIVTFDTDFDVKFGTFTCFDIFYQDPGITLTRSVGVRDIVYPTAWFSETPFLTAPQVQSGWSFAEDVNFLASGFHHPPGSNGGSGIYLGKQGIANATMPLNDTYPGLIIADVPKKGEKYGLVRPHKRLSPIPPPPSPDIMSANIARVMDIRVHDLALMRDEFLTQGTTELITTDSVKKTLCYKNFCADFTVEILKKDPKVYYRLVVLNGVRNFLGARTVGMRACAVVQCWDKTLKSCGAVNETTTIFDKINIEAVFDDYRNSLIMPATLNTSVFPLQNWDYNENGYNDVVRIQLSTNEIVRNLATFGLYSRYYARDDVNQRR